MIDERLLESAKRGTKRTGQSQLIKYLSWHRLTQRQAIAAKCYDCNGMGEQKECDMESCSLYPYSPYRLKTLKSLQHHPAYAGEKIKAS